MQRRLLADGLCPATPVCLLRSVLWMVISTALVSQQVLDRVSHRSHECKLQDLAAGASDSGS